MTPGSRPTGLDGWVVTNLITECGGTVALSAGDDHAVVTARLPTVAITDEPDLTAVANGLGIGTLAAAVAAWRLPSAAV